MGLPCMFGWERQATCGMGGLGCAGWWYCCCSFCGGAGRGGAVVAVDSKYERCLRARGSYGGFFLCLAFGIAVCVELAGCLVVHQCLTFRLFVGHGEQVRLVTRYHSCFCHSTGLLVNPCGSLFCVELWGAVFVDNKAVSVYWLLGSGFVCMCSDICVLRAPALRALNEAVLWYGDGR